MLSQQRSTQHPAAIRLRSQIALLTLVDSYHSITRSQELPPSLTPSLFLLAMDLRKVRVEVVIISTACAGLLGAAYAVLSYFRKRDFYNIPAVQGGYPFFGQVFTMLKGSPWDTMTEWAREYGGIFRFHLFGSDAVVISDPGILKVVLSTKLSNFKKDGRSLSPHHMPL